jgi:hypothetical protein
MGVQVQTEVAAHPVGSAGAGRWSVMIGPVSHPQVQVSMGMSVHGSADQQLGQSLPPLPAGYAAPSAPRTVTGASGSNDSTTSACTSSVSLRISISMARVEKAPPDGAAARV